MYSEVIPHAGNHGSLRNQNSKEYFRKFLCFFVVKRIYLGEEKSMTAFRTIHYRESIN